MVETHPEKSLIGYARVSTYGQTLDSQLEQLRAAGCTSRNIYREKVTGAHSDLNRSLNGVITDMKCVIKKSIRIDSELSSHPCRQTPFENNSDPVGVAITILPKPGD